MTPLPTLAAIGSDVAKGSEAAAILAQ